MFRPQVRLFFQLLVWVLAFWVPHGKLPGVQAMDDPNQLSSLNSLRNEYAVLRHGQSMANVAKVIASNPESAIEHYGLSDLGKEQAAQAGDEVVQAFLRRENTSRQRRVLLLASDFRRAKETAKIVQQKLQKAGIPLYKNDNINEGLVLETRLRERWFGEWDDTSDANYQNVWKDDATNPDHIIHGVESVHHVMERTTRCILEWDDAVQDCFIVCVAHGDVLQILQTAFAKMDGSKHRTVEHLETAKLRCLELL